MPDAQVENPRGQQVFTPAQVDSAVVVSGPICRRCQTAQGIALGETQVPLDCPAEADENPGCDGAYTLETA